MSMCMNAKEIELGLKRCWPDLVEHVEQVEHGVQAYLTRQPDGNVLEDMKFIAGEPDFGIFYYTFPQVR